MASLFLKFLNMSITAGWLILAVTGLRFLLKKAPKWQVCLLWSVVGIRLIFPFSLKSALSLIPSGQTVSPDILYSADPGIQSGIPAFNSWVNPVISETFTQSAGASVNPLQVWIQVAAYIWLAGMVLLLLYTAFSYGRLKRKVIASIRLEDRVFICDEIETPFFLGLVKPRIYLPSGLDRGQQALILAHEGAHLKRRDHWWKPLGFLLLTLYWFNPLTWLAYILLCRDIEMACDEKVIRDLGKEGRLEYSQTLLASSIPHRAIMACPLAFGEVAVKERIRSVLHYKKPAFWIILLALIASMVLAVCFLTNPKDDPAAPPDPSGSETLPVPAAPLAVEWFNFLGAEDLADWPESLETSLAEFPGVTFRWTAGELAAVTEGRTETLILGMPIHNIFFCDLTGDGKPELCSTISLGSGIMDTHVVVVDFENKVHYLLWHRGFHDYDLYLQEDVLFVAMRPWMKKEILESGPLVLEDGLLTIKGRLEPLPRGEQAKEVDYQAFTSEVGYSEAGYQAMVERAENRDSQRQDGNAELLTPLVKLENRADFDAFYRDLSAYLDFDMDDADSVIFSRQAQKYSDAFFSDHTLFIVYLTAGTNADRFELLEAFTKSGQLNLPVRHIQAASGDTVMDGWLLLVEISKTEIADCPAYDTYIAESTRPYEESSLVSTYLFEGLDPVDRASLQLFDNGDFLLDLHAAMSYIPSGRYVIEDDLLILKTPDSQFTFVFDRRADGWSFRADSSTPAYANLPSMADGSLFRFTSRGPHDRNTVEDWLKAWDQEDVEAGSLQLTLYRYDGGVPVKVSQKTARGSQSLEAWFLRLLNLEIMEVENPAEAMGTSDRLELQFFDKKNQASLFLAFQVADERPDNLYINGNFLPAEEVIPENTFLSVGDEGWVLFKELMESLD